MNEVTGLKQVIENACLADNVHVCVVCAGVCGCANVYMYVWEFGCMYPCVCTEMTCQESSQL